MLLLYFIFVVFFLLYDVFVLCCDLPEIQILIDTSEDSSQSPLGDLYLKKKKNEKRKRKGKK